MSCQKVDELVRAHLERVRAKRAAQGEACACHPDGFSCAEVVGVLGTSEGAVMTRLTRARQALRAHFADSGKRRAARIDHLLRARVDWNT